MTRASLARIVADELATLRCLDSGDQPRGRPRRTEWSDRLPGFGIRHYASGRSTYIVQTLMAGVTRTVTLGNANVLSNHQALTVARRVMLAPPDFRHLGPVQPGRVAGPALGQEQPQA